MDPLELVERIHDTPHLLVMNFAGAGSQALAWLHAVGGSSRTVLEVVDRYTAPSLADATGFIPKQFTSLRVADALAEHAYGRAKWIVERLPGDVGRVVFGVGLTATIATDRVKRGDHRMALAVRDAFGITSHEVVLEKGLRDRAGEEALVSRFALEAIATASGVLHAAAVDWSEEERLHTEFEPAPAVRAFLAGERAFLRLDPDASWAEDPPTRDLALVSGSFHPVHEGHFELARVAAEHSGRQVVFELPLANAAKGEVPLQTARRRAAQFATRAPLMLTRAPLFVQKAELFPGALFVIGADTADRVVDPRFYDGSPERMRGALQEIRSRGCRFLVAGRASRDTFRTLEDVALPEGFEDLFEGLPEAEFRKDVSSTEIRETWASSGDSPARS